MYSKMMCATVLVGATLASQTKNRLVKAESDFAPRVNELAHRYGSDAFGPPLHTAERKIWANQMEQGRQSCVDNMLKNSAICRTINSYVGSSQILRIHNRIMEQAFVMRNGVLYSGDDMKEIRQKLWKMKGHRGPLVSRMDGKSHYFLLRTRSQNALIKHDLMEVIRDISSMNLGYLNYGRKNTVGEWKVLYNYEGGDADELKKFVSELEGETTLHTDKPYYSKSGLPADTNDVTYMLYMTKDTIPGWYYVKSRTYASGRNTKTVQFIEIEEEAIPAQNQNAVMSDALTFDADIIYQPPKRVRNTVGHVPGRIVICKRTRKRMIKAGIWQPACASSKEIDFNELD